MNSLIYFKLIRWKNLLLISYTFILLKFVLFPSFQIETLLSNFQFIILLVSVLLITASGYIINDIFDIKADEINKPKKLIVSKLITIEKANSWYKITNTIGIFLGILLCLNIAKPTYSFIFIGAALLLYYYSKNLKGKPFIGNIIVSFLTAFSILILVIFDIDLSVESILNSLVINIVLLLSIFAFMISVAREMVKDIEDINGDYSLSLNTLPIVIGRKRTKRIIRLICFAPILLILFLAFNYSDEYKYTVLYLTVFTFIPLFYIFLKLRTVKTKKEYQKISLLLKIIMFLGVNSILVISKFH